MPKSAVSSAATAALMQQQMETIKRLEREKAEAEARANQGLVEKHLGNSTIAAKPTNGQTKNDFLPWMGGIFDPSSPFFLPLGKNFPIQIINHSRIKESKDYGKQWLFDVVIHHPATNSATGAGKFTWSMKVDDARIGRIIDLLAAGKPVLIYRQEYLDAKTNITKSTIKIS